MPDWLMNVPSEFWIVLSQMAPYLLFGFLVAGGLSVLVSPAFVERHLGGRGFVPVLKAAAFGVPLPLCSCGVIPVSASIRRHGASRGATVGFLISTPQTGVDSIMVTYSLLGWVLAVFRPLAALVSGLIGGMFVSAMDGDGDSRNSSPAASDCHAACCDDGAHSNRLVRALSYGLVTLPRDIGRALLIGLLIAAVISALVPEESLAPWLGGGIGAMLIMMVLGIPVYVCATASVPVAAALIAKGVSPGAAVVFLMTGPATNAATIATVWKVLGRRTAVIYLLTVALSALGAGLLLDVLIENVRIGSVAHVHAAGVSYAEQISAVVLLGVLGFSFLRGSAGDGHHTRDHEASEQEMTTTLTIEGMTCGHCADSVRRALSECPGVTAATVDLAAGTARVSGEQPDVAALSAAVTGLGYRVVDSHTETTADDGSDNDE